MAPTFIDAHFHPEYTMLLPGETGRLIVQRGTTTLFADPVCIANVLGSFGMDMIGATSTPLRFFAQVTPDVPRRGHVGIDGARVAQAEILERVKRDSAVGLGESNPFLLDEEMAEGLSVSIAAGKRITGHTARLSDEPLWAYAAGGVGDDHNAATLDEVFERLRLGMIVTLQVGRCPTTAKPSSATRNYADSLPHTLRSVPTTSTSKTFTIRCDRHHVRSTVALGIAPAMAIRMASLNAASHFRIVHDPDLGHPRNAHDA